MHQQMKFPILYTMNYHMIPKYFAEFHGKGKMCSWNTNTHDSN